jgi:hypothetical protein
MTATVLVVSENLATCVGWGTVLRNAGYRVLTCPGPSQYPCPRLGTGPCSVREHADCAVVEVQGFGGLPYGEWGEHACTKLPDDGRTIFISEPDGPRGPGAHLSHPVSPDLLLNAVDAALRWHPTPA